MKKILFITDSLGLPRLYPEKISGENVWSNILATKLHCEYNNSFKFFNFSQGGLNSKMLKNALQNGPLPAFEPDIVVLQLGIVDSSPRALRKLELSILSRIFILNKIVRYLVRKFYTFIVLKRDITYVSTKDFKNNMLYIKNFYMDKEILVIPIALANNEYRKKNPNIQRNIDIYNDVLKGIFREGFLDNIYTPANLEKLFTSDNHHLSIYGHNFLADQVFVEIKKRYI